MKYFTAHEQMEALDKIGDSYNVSLFFPSGRSLEHVDVITHGQSSLCIVNNQTVGGQWVQYRALERLVVHDDL